MSVSYTHLDVYKRQLYVNDVPRQPGVPVALFADDTAVFTADRHVERGVLRLQRQLGTHGDWTENWRVQLNATKCVAVEFSKRRKIPVRQLRNARTYLRWSKEVKFLGLHLYRRLT